MTTHNDELKPSTVKFGDRLRNKVAGEKNPHRDGFFVRTVIRTGRLNPGKWAELTDGKGEFWQTTFANLERTPSNEPQPAAGRLTDEQKDAIYNAWRDQGDDVSYGDLIDMVEQAVLSSRSMQVVGDDWKLVPTATTDEMIDAAQEAYMPFGDMYIAIAMANHAAPTPPASNTEK